MCGRRNGFVVDGGRLPLAFVMRLVVVCIYFLQYYKKKKNKKPAGLFAWHIYKFKKYFRARSRVFLALVLKIIINIMIGIMWIHWMIVRSVMC